MTTRTTKYEPVSSLSAHRVSVVFCPSSAVSKSEIVCRDIERLLCSASQLSMEREAGYDQIFRGAMNFASYLTIGSCFSVHCRVMEHAGSLESTKEA